MKRRARNLVAVFGEYQIAREVREDEIEQLGRDVLEKANVYNDPDDHRSTTKVTLFEVKLINGKIERVPAGSVDAVPWCRQLTELEYNKAMDDAVEPLPKEFQDYVRQESYDRGHSAGWSEVLNYARSMTTELLPVVNQYTTRITKAE